MAGNTLTQLTGIDTLKGQYVGRRYFTKEFLNEVSALITASERQHQAELVVAIERKMPPHIEVTRDRALEVFGRLKVWDTPLKTGLLLYLSLDRQAIEIIADRGIGVDNSQWVAVTELIAQHFQQKQFREGLVSAVKQIEDLLTTACPLDNSSQADNEAEQGEGHLANTPVIL